MFKLTAVFLFLTGWFIAIAGALGLYHDGGVVGANTVSSIALWVMLLLWWLALCSIVASVANGEWRL